MCEDYSSRLSAYIDNELPIDERQTLDLHLTGCASCQEELRALREAVALSSILPEIAPPTDLRMMIYARTIHRRSLRTRIQETLLAPRAWGYAASLAGIACILAYGLHSERSVKRITANFTPSAKSALSSTKNDAKPEKIAKLDPDSIQKRIERVINEVKESIAAAKEDDEAKPEKIRADSEMKSPLIANAAVTEATLPAHPRHAALKAPLNLKRAPSAPAAKAGKTLLADLPRSRRPATKPAPEPFDSVPTVGSPSPMPDHQPASAADSSPRNGAPTASSADDPKEGDNVIASRPRSSVTDDLAKLTDSHPALKVEEKDIANRIPVDELMKQLNAAALSSAPQVEWKIARIRIKL